MWSDNELDPSESTAAWSREQAQAWRERNRPLQIKQVLLFQLLVMVLVALVVWLLVGYSQALSLAYGVLAVWVPALFFGKGVQGRMASLHATGAAAAFMLWELWKLVMTIALLALAPKSLGLWAEEVQWLWLLLGVMLTIKLPYLVVVCHRWQMK